MGNIIIGFLVICSPLFSAIYLAATKKPGY